MSRSKGSGRYFTASDSTVANARDIDWMANRAAHGPCEVPILAERTPGNAEPRVAKSAVVPLVARAQDGSEHAEFNVIGRAVEVLGPDVHLGEVGAVSRF